jgi:hypothetical protein
LKKRNLRKRKKTRQTNRQSNALKEPSPDGVRLEEKGEDMPQLDYTQGMLKKRQAEQRPPQAPVGTPPAQAPPAAAAPAGSPQPTKQVAPHDPNAKQGGITWRPGLGQETTTSPVGAGAPPPPPPPPASTTSTGTQMPIQPPANIPSMKDFQWQQPTQTPTPGMGPGGAPGLQKPGFMPGGEQTTPQTGPGMKGKGGGQKTTMPEGGTTEGPNFPGGSTTTGNPYGTNAPPPPQGGAYEPPPPDPNAGGAGPGFEPYQEPAPQEQPQRFQGGLM